MLLSVRRTTTTRTPDEETTMKTCPLQHEIDGLIVENDLDALAEMLELYEDDDDLRYLLYEAIDLVTRNLNLPLECDICNLD
jgi:hypothetical protein